MDGHVTVLPFLKFVPISSATLHRRLAAGTIPECLKRSTRQDGGD